MEALRLRTKKHLGVLRAALRARGRPVPHDWWDSDWYRDPLSISDGMTISTTIDELATRYHYATTEATILRALRATGGVTEGPVVDIGSGSGHWVAFYRSLGFQQLTAVEVSKNAADHLARVFSSDPSVDVINGSAAQALEEFAASHQFSDVINAIGVLFHIVDDSEWERTIRAAYSTLNPGGRFVVGGLFSAAPTADTQHFDGLAQKRLRSARCWRQTLRISGFSAVQVFKNRGQWELGRRLPESNILIATK